MWEEGVHIYDIFKIFNNFPRSWGHASQIIIIIIIVIIIFIYLNIKLKLRPFKFLYRIEWLTSLHLWIPVNSTSKVSHDWVTDLRFNPHLQQKWLVSRSAHKNEGTPSS